MKSIFYDRVFHRSATLAATLHAQALKVDDHQAAKTFYNDISQPGSRQVPGIGPIIAAKIVKYLFREIELGRTKPGDFKGIAGQLAGEYHQQALIKELEQVYGPGFLKASLDSLTDDFADPFASDVFYYIHRERNDLIQV